MREIEITDPCLQCGKPLGCSFVTEGNSRASHYSCYHRARPPRLAKTVTDVVIGGADPEYSRRLVLSALLTYTTPGQQDGLIQAYNEEITRAHQRRCEREGDEG